MKSALQKSVPNYKDALLCKIMDKSANIAVVGLGYVGLPLAVEQAKIGFQVLGIDLSLKRTKQINLGQNYISDVKNEELAAVVKSGAFRAECDFKNISDADIIVIAVPTPLTQHLVPDLSYIESASKEIARNLRPGQLVCLESTTYPGTTEQLVLPLLEKSGLCVERDFYLVYSPERVDPGNRLFSTSNTNKIVGGIGLDSLEVGVAFYSQAIPKIVPVQSTGVAEMAKVFENTFRSVNIALVNEMALLCDKMNLNIWDVLDAAFTKPFGIMPFYPGPGVGGHCIPLDPHYLEWKAKEHNCAMRFIALAGEINRKMPEFVVTKTNRILNNMGKAISKSKLLVLGVAYKKNVSDHRESPSVDVIRLLKAEGAHVSYHDPQVPHISEPNFELSSIPLNENSLKAADVVLLLTSHSNVDYAYVLRHAKHLFDTRNACKHITENREKITLL